MPGKVGVVGTGLIGRGWAVAFARAGWEVSLWDLDPDAAAAAVGPIRQSLADLREAGLLRNGVEPTVSVAPTLTAALAGSVYAQESVPEVPEIKRAVFARIGEEGPDDLIAGSSSSTLPGSAFLADLPGRGRFIVAHPANPPHLMPVVEVVPSPWHDRALVERVTSLLSSIGQVPVVVKAEIEGFVMNRLQTAVVNEAVALVAAGVVEPADLDAVMKHSLGLRWALMGPFETMDLNAPNGFADYATRYGHLYEAMGRSLSVAAPWPPAALHAIEASRRAETPTEAVAARMRWRDQALMRLLVLMRSLSTTEEATR